MLHNEYGFLWFLFSSIMVKKYKLYNLYKYIVIPVFMTFYALLHLKVLIEGNYIPNLYIFFHLGLYMWLGLYAWYKFLTSVYEIVIDKNNYIEFKSIIKRKKIHPQTVIAVKENYGLYLIKHVHGEITVISMMNNFDEFKSVVKKINPHVKENFPTHRGFKY